MLTASLYPYPGDLNAGSACASVPLRNKPAQIISCVTLSDDIWNFLHTLRLSAPSCLTFHSPSPKTFRPTSVDDQMRDFITGWRFYAELHC